MPAYRIIDEHVLSENEFRAHAPTILELFAKRGAGTAVRSLSLSKERTLSAVGPAAPPAPIGPPVGLNLPLTILIRDVYTGLYPERGWFRSTGDVAVVSGVKNYAIFDATARAVNFVKKSVDNHSHLTASAFDIGTPVVAHYPAVTTDSVTMTVEIAIAQFPKELFEYLASAFQSLASLPVLLPYAGYLLGAGSVIKLASGLGDALFDGHPPFSITNSLNFDVPGSAPPTSDFRILCGSNLDPEQYRFRDGIGLVDANGQKYAGDEPYVVVSLDGRPRPELKDFAAKAASAAVLQKFFQMKDGAQATIDTVVGGIKLLSDFKYREQAVELKEQIAQMKEGTDKSAAQARYDALLTNISNATLKP